MPEEEKIFSDEEVSAVETRYPGVKRSGPGTIQGTLDMDAIYEGKAISEKFEIKITASNPNSDLMPALYEIGGRTHAIAKKFGISNLKDLHHNPKDETACVCVKQEEKGKFPPGSTLFTFVEDLVVPYLYGLVSYEQKRRWPWGDYSHGSLGLLEYYAVDMSPQIKEDVWEILLTIRRDLEWREYYKQFKKPSAKRSCPCGSGKQIRKCHEKAWKGLSQFHKELLRLDLDPGVLA